MSNPYLVTWIARMEHEQRSRASARNERLLDDILPDDFELRAALISGTVPSNRLNGASATLKNWLLALNDRIRSTRQLALEPSRNEECLGCAD